MRNLSASIYIFFLFVIYFLSACSTTKHLGEDEYLLKKNTIDIEGIDTIEDNRRFKNELLDLALQQPNSRTFFLPIRLWIYNATYDTTKGINRWLNDKLGEPPVIYDSSLAVRTTDIMEKYLFNKGYFNADATFETEKDNKKAVVNYNVSKRILSYIKEVHYEIEDDRILRLVYLNDPLLEPGEPYDVDDLLAERQRITRNMRNYGYWRFNKQYIYYEVDTLDFSDSLAIYTKVEPPSYDSVHYRYFINNIYIYPDYIRDGANISQNNDTININEYYIISRELDYKPKALLDAIFFRKDDLYKLDDHELTINRLTDLGVFSFVNVRFEELEEDGRHLLNVHIELLPSKKQGITLDLEAYTNATEFYGIDAGFSYRNKNLFNYTDLFVFNFNAGFESALSEGLVNIIDLRGDASIYFPKFLVPFNVGRMNRSFNPKTKISLSYNYFKRVDYFTLHNIAASYGFDWKEFEPKRHILNIPVINFVLVTDRSQSFLDKLEESPFLRRSFENQFIIGGEYSYIFNNRGLVDDKTEHYFRFNFDAAGNTLWLLNNTLRGGFGEEHDYYFQLGDSLYKYSQYVKPDVEFRFYRNFNNNTTWASRAFAGVGYSWGNSSVMPYIKQYVVGGPNSVRAFRIRSLGPGSYEDTTNTAEDDLFFIDRTGDIKIELSTEYRFDITGIFEGAFFLDAGNIWLLRKEPTKPGGVFEFSDFLNEMALGTGAGLRLDFSFFIIRFDVGIPIIDPRAPGGNRMVLNDWSQNLNFNLAIGYPY